MNGFINNILRRHTDSAASIMPRLPGKFEPVNFHAANSTGDLSVSTEASQPFNVIQTITDTAVENKNAAGINAGKSIPTTNSRMVADQNIQPLHDNTRPFNESANTGQTSIIKNINQPEKGTDEKITGENISGVERQGFNEIKPISQFKEKPQFENFDQQELTGNMLIKSQSGRLNRKDDNENDNDPLVKKNVIKPVTKKESHVLEDVKSLQAGLIKPAIQNFNAGPNLNASPVLREQTMSSVIKVSIGRIEVRAVTSAAPVKVNRPVLQKPRLSLDEYLKNRNGAQK